MAVLRRRHDAAGCHPPLCRRLRSVETQDTMVVVLRRRQALAGCLSLLTALLALRPVFSAPIRRRLCCMESFETLVAVAQRRHEPASCFPPLR